MFSQSRTIKSTILTWLELQYRGEWRWKNQGFQLDMKACLFRQESRQRIAAENEASGSQSEVIGPPAQNCPEIAGQISRGGVPHEVS